MSLPLLFAGPSAPSVPLLTGLVSYWPLSEASGTRSDIHGTNHLTDNSVGQGAALVFGEASADFELGTPSFLTLADNPTLSAPAQSHAISLWAKFESLAGLGETLIQKGSANTAANHEYFIQVSGTARLATRISNGTSSASVTGTTTLFVVGTLYHLVLAYDVVAGTYKTYVNGVLESTSAALAGAGWDSAKNLCFGAFNGGVSQYFDGQMGQVALWTNRFITAGDVVRLYNGGAGLPYSAFG